MAGGTYREDDPSSPGVVKEVAVLTRIDLPKHIHRWSRTYHVNNDSTISSHVLGMAISPDGLKLAAWVSESKDGSKENGYLFTINCDDGGILTQ